jgi:hypothetical protein
MLEYLRIRQRISAGKIGSGVAMMLFGGTSNVAPSPTNSGVVNGKNLCVAACDSSEKETQDVNGVRRE